MTGRREGRIDKRRLRGKEMIQDGELTARMVRSWDVIQGDQSGCDDVERRRLNVKEHAATSSWQPKIGSHRRTFGMPVQHIL